MVRQLCNFTVFLKTKENSFYKYASRSVSRILS